MEAAMAKAVADAGKEGITDPGKIRERMMAAKDKARVEFEAAAARAARK
jgi:3-oxoacyl-[acyl-carrier-protein] synthase III